MIKRNSHIATVEGELKEVRGTISNHVLEGVVIQAEVLQGAHDAGKCHTQDKEVLMTSINKSCSNKFLITKTFIVEVYNGELLLWTHFSAR